LGGTGDDVEPPSISCAFSLYLVFFRANRKKRPKPSPSSQQSLSRHQARRAPMLPASKMTSMPVRTKEASLTLKKAKVRCLNYSL
jgi:hypothetical protein